MPTPRKGYFLADGTTVPSVTTILSRFKESGGLIQWAYKQGKEGKDLYEIKAAAASAGTMAHAAIEHYVNGEEPRLVFTDAPDDVIHKAESAFDAYLTWERHSKLRIVAQEIQLVCDLYKFGGTPDAVGVIDGELCLLDWKTSNDIYSDYLIQLAAYGWLVGYGISMDTYKPLNMQLTGGYHLLRFAKETGDFAHHYYKDLREAWEAFILQRQLFDLCKSLKERVKG